MPPLPPPRLPTKHPCCPPDRLVACDVISKGDLAQKALPTSCSCRGLLGTCTHAWGPGPSAGHLPSGLVARFCPACVCWGAGSGCRDRNLTSPPPFPWHWQPFAGMFWMLGHLSLVEWARGDMETSGRPEKGPFSSCHILTMTAITRTQTRPDPGLPLHRHNPLGSV